MPLQIKFWDWFSQLEMICLRLASLSVGWGWLVYSEAGSWTWKWLSPEEMAKSGGCFYILCTTCVHRISFCVQPVYNQCTSLCHCMEICILLRSLVFWLIVVIVVSSETGLVNLKWFCLRRARVGWGWLVYSEAGSWTWKWLSPEEMAKSGGVFTFCVQPMYTGYHSVYNLCTINVQVLVTVWRYVSSYVLWSFGWSLW
jgi:hypothetical protein